MDVPSQDIHELFDLLNKLLDNRLSIEQKARLEQMLQDNPALQAHYVEFFLLSSELRYCLSPWDVELSRTEATDHLADLQALSLDIPAPARTDNQPVSEAERINQIKQRAERQLQAYLDEQERQRALQRRWQGRHDRRVVLDLTGLVHKVESLLTWTGRSIVTVAACMAVILMVAGILHVVRSQRVVARLGDTVHAHWGGAAPNADLRAGTLHLDQGVAELTFAKGARVIIQAPCTFTLESSSAMSVNEGTVTARVPKPAVGFTINTVTSSIKDFGTEFGVTVDRAAQTEVHVFDGLIRLSSAERGRVGPNQWELTRGHAAVVDRQGGIRISNLAERPRLFLRNLPDVNQLGVPGQCLDLSDIIGGGNGLGTGIPGMGLQPRTGLPTSDLRQDFNRSAGYVPTRWNTFIDGVFIPDAETDSSVTISSTGLRFSGCPDTSGVCAHVIRNGIRFQHDGTTFQTGILQGRTYGVAGHPAIGMHANAGVTFDLTRIRAAHGDANLECFRALCGISETVGQVTDGYWQSQRIAMEFWVLVDGAIRFHETLYAVPAHPAEIYIPLTDAERFLTLVTTESHPDRAFTWGLFAEPRLELASQYETVSKPALKSAGMQ